MITRDDKLINGLQTVVNWCVKVLAVLSVFVIVWSTLDVVYHLWKHSTESRESIFSADRLLQDLGVLLAVMIAIEIFMNIIYFLLSDTIYVPLVLATALTAVARKIIILDYSTVSYELIVSMASVILATGVVYWLVTKPCTTD